MGNKQQSFPWLGSESRPAVPRVDRAVRISWRAPRRARCGVADAESRWAWACPRCAGPGCCAARRAAAKGPASRPRRAAIPHATRSGRRCRLRHAAALSRARGPQALFLHAARERGPLGELTGLQVAARCSARCGAGQIATPVTAKPDAGPLNAGMQTSAYSGSTVAPVARLRLPWCHVGRRAAAARHVAVGCTVLRRPWEVAARAPVVPPRSPQLRPRPQVRGTCGGIFKRWAGELAHCFGC
jgi:hypothetical protein